MCPSQLPAILLFWKDQTMNSSVQQLFSWLDEILDRNFSYLFLSLFGLDCMLRRNTLSLTSSPLRLKWSFYPCVRNLAQEMFKIFLINENLVLLFFPFSQCSWWTFIPAHLFVWHSTYFNLWTLLRNGLFLDPLKVMFFHVLSYQ